MDTLPIDIKISIASVSCDTWIWLALRDVDLYNYTVKYPYYFTKLFTEYSEEVEERFMIGNINIQKWKLFGKLHSINDQPAEIEDNNCMKWYYNGNLHRDAINMNISSVDGASYGEILPAIISKTTYKEGRRINGHRYWVIHGKHHREGDLPAITTDNGRCENGIDYAEDGFINGTKAWYKNGMHHRDNDKPAFCHAKELFMGELVEEMEWRVDGLLHRDNDLPAHIRIDGALMWYQRGKRHRDIGPAVIMNGVNLYYKHGEKI